MTKDEAIEQMEAGKKITHSNFSADEWMTIDKGEILTEDGYRHDILEWWMWRTQSAWNEGYSLLQD